LGGRREKIGCIEGKMGGKRVARGGGKQQQ